MTFISRRKTVEVVTYSLFFERTALPGSGFGFACDASGKVDVDSLNPCARGNHDALVAGTMPGFEEPIVTEHMHRYTEPAVIRCECNSTVALYGFTNTCVRCERDYNMSGQLLAPREQWGEETGESVSDILSVDSMESAMMGEYD